jgi:hypothetical protein
MNFRVRMVTWESDMMAVGRPGGTLDADYIAVLRARLMHFNVLVRTRSAGCRFAVVLAAKSRGQRSKLALSKCSSKRSWRPASLLGKREFAQHWSITTLTLQHQTTTKQFF